MTLTSAARLEPDELAALMAAAETCVVQEAQPAGAAGPTGDARPVRLGTSRGDLGGMLSQRRRCHSAALFCQLHAWTMHGTTPRNVGIGGTAANEQHRPWPGMLQWAGGDADPFRALLCHPRIKPVLETVLGNNSHG